MIEESATVVASAEGTAWVETVRRSACSSCGEGGACGSAVLGRLFAPGSNRLAVADDLDLQVGDRVVIGIPDSLLVRASLAAYLFPLAALVGAAGLADWLGLGDVLVALIGVAGLGVGLWLTGVFTGGTKARERYRPVVLRRETVRIRVQGPHGVRRES